VSRPNPERLRRAAPLALAVALAAMYVAVAPHTADLAAQTARADLFRRSGYVPYWSGWYGGAPTSGYSLVTPPLLGWLGPVWLGALSIVAAAAIAMPLLRSSRRPLAGAVAVALSATFDVLSGRMTFALGVAVALAALLAIERQKRSLGFLAAALATLTSPVAGVLLVVAAAATVLAGPRRRVAGISALAGIALAVIALAVLTGGSRNGYEPFTRTSLLLSVGTTLVVVVSPVGRRVRVVGWLTLWMLLACFLVHTPVGANATRIAVLGAAPAVVAAARWPRPLLVLAVAVAALLPIGQLYNDMWAAANTDGSPAFVAGLERELVGAPDIDEFRVEVLDTRTHWPSTYLLPALTLARGWERQTDEARNSIFYGRSSLTAATYRTFLRRNAVGFVAVPIGVGLDYGSTHEASLIATGLPYLREIWSDSHWRLYAVTDPTRLVTGTASVVATSDTGLTIEAAVPGRYVVRMRWSPYLVVAGAQLRRTNYRFVAITVPRAGEYRIHAEWGWP
jgi:hypothetical protein